MIRGDDLELFTATLARATESATGPSLDAALAEFGWHEALVEDPRTAVSVLFDLQGRTGATSSALDAVVARALGCEEPGIAVVLPKVGRTGAPGRLEIPDVDELTVSGLGTVTMSTAPEALVAVGDDGAPRLVRVATEALELRAVAGMDPTLGLVEVDGSPGPDRSQASGSSASWSEAVRVGQLALAHELIGASRTMLDLAREHAVERIQFGQPIARFQAIRHRLAEAYVAVESAEAAADAAWLEGSTLAAAAAKAIAGRSGRTVARHAQQVLAGIGFTTEHDLHRYVRRTLVVDGLLGDARSLTRTMGTEILHRRRLPPMQPL